MGTELVGYFAFVLYAPYAWAVNFGRPLRYGLERVDMSHDLHSSEAVHITPSRVGIIAI